MANRAAEIIADRKRLEANKNSGYFDPKIDDDLKTYFDADGNEIQLLTARHSMPLLKGTHRLHLGRALIGCITGRWGDDSELERLAMGGSTNIGGGILVTDELAVDVIDFARARSVVVQAGVRTIPFTSDRLVMARAISDPTLSYKAENEAFAGTSVQFDGIGFDAKTFGNYIAISRELAEDAPNASDVLQAALGNALATSLDNQALQGSGVSGQPTGISNNTSVSETSASTLTWAKMNTATVGVMGYNFEPNAYVCSPTNAGRLAVLTSGDGTNSAAMWQGPPATVAPLAKYASTNAPDATLYVGQWDQAAFGVRQEAMVEVTTTGGDSFVKHQLLIKITWRGDFALLQPRAFHRLISIAA